MNWYRRWFTKRNFLVLCIPVESHFLEWYCAICIDLDRFPRNHKIIGKRWTANRDTYWNNIYLLEYAFSWIRNQLYYDYDKIDFDRESLSEESYIVRIENIKYESIIRSKIRNLFIWTRVAWQLVHIIIVRFCYLWIFNSSNSIVKR